MWRTRHLRSDELKTYLRQSVQFIFNRVNEQFDESESEVRYLITHILDRVIYILSQASLLFYVFESLSNNFLTFDELSATNLPTRWEQEKKKKLVKE